MITKLATFRGISSEGEPLVRVFHPGDSIKKVAGVLMPEVQDWLSAYKKEDAKIAVLVNAMGASEYWGQNINGDIFYESALVHDCRRHPSLAHPVDDFTGKIVPPYGYWTFLNALPFVHHKNKDPTRAFGIVAVACWNPHMRRVELVVIIDRALAMQHGAQSVVDRIDAGECADVSMGTRVPYDRCSLCNHKSKTRNDYCSCLKEVGVNKILDDGRQIGMINDYPRFFDISFVFIGADKTAKVMCKLGSAHSNIPQSVLDAEYLYGPSEGLMKAASGREWTEEEKEEAKLRTKRQVQKMVGGVTGSLIGGGLPLAFNKPKLVIPGALAGLMVGRVVGSKLASANDPDIALRDLVRKGPSVRLYMGKNDVQETPGRSSIGDGILRTNAAQDERDTYPKPLTPSRGKVASAYDYALWMKRKIAADVLAGGKADGKPSSDFSSDQLAMGKKVEKEHTHSEELAEEIARDHLEEIPDYYTRLKKMEDNAEKEKKAGSLGPVFSLAKDIEIGPPPSPNRKEYPFVGIIHFNGLTVHVENKPGDVREGTDPNGKKWRTEMKLPYGEINGTLGVDQDKLDAYVGPYEDADNVYIIHQNKVTGEDKGKYDEDKVMLGFKDDEQAKEAYLAHYNRPDYFRSMTVMSLDLFKKALRTKEVHGEKVASAYSGMMEKVAYDLRLEDLFSNSGPSSKRVRIWRDKENGRETVKSGSGMESFDKTKTAAPRKFAAQLKSADIDKEILPEKAVGRVSPILSSLEENLPKETLDDMANSGLESALATPSLMGMVLKPEEFQRIVLVCNGRDDLANDLDNRNAVFSDSDLEEPLPNPLSNSDLSTKILEKLLPHLENRSYFEPVVRRRVIRIIVRNPKPVETSPIVETSPLLSKVGAAYNWYRKQQVKLASGAGRVIKNHPKLYTAIAGVDEVDLFKGASAINIDPKLLGVMVGSIPLSLMYSAHLRGQREQGVDLPLWKDLIADHPYLSTAGSLAALRKILQTPQGRQALEEIFSAGKRIWTGKPPSSLSA